MTLTFVITAIILLTVYATVSHILFPLAQIAKVNKKLMREGVEAQAVLLNMEQTGVYVNNRPQVRLEVQVHPLRGQNFVSETREVLTLIDLSRLCIGSTLKVKYNPANTKELMVLRS